jgi:chromodomain-helicase-DNA-binding protein 7
LLVDLTVADTANIYDSDSNPQNDLQARSRCHRFGQTKDLKVDRLITRDTFEGKMFQSVSKKLGIDFTVLDANSGDLDREDEKEIEILIRKGPYHIFNDEWDKLN